MASGDVQRAWFPEMLADLRQRWLSHEMSWDELAAFCREMTEKRQKIKEERNIKTSWGRCRTCGGKLTLGPLSMRSALFALRKMRIIDDDRLKSLDRDWNKYRKTNGLDAYGNKGKSCGAARGGPEQRHRNDAGVRSRNHVV